MKAREMTSSLTLMIGMRMNVMASIKGVHNLEENRGRNLFHEVESGLEGVKKHYDDAAKANE